MSELIHFTPFPFLMKETPNGDGDTSESMTEAFSQLVFDDDPSVVFSEITGVMSSESSEEELYDEKSNQASLRRKKLNEFLVESGMKDTHIGPPKSVGSYEYHNEKYACVQGYKCNCGSPQCLNTWKCRK